MSEMIERVARALSAKALTLGTAGHIGWDQMARTAIEAMREPTEAMKEALVLELNDWDRRYDGAATIAVCAYDAMVDAALAPDPTAPTNQ